jgi:hypothetical protein
MWLLFDQQAGGGSGRSSRRSSTESRRRLDYIQGSWERVTGERVSRAPSASEHLPMPRLIVENADTTRKVRAGGGGRFFFLCIFSE